MSLREYLFHEEPGVTLYCGDCRDVLPLLDRADAVITDPPFNVRRDSWDTFADAGDFLAFTCSWMIAAARVAPLVASFFPDKFLPTIRRAAEIAGLPYRRALIWRKPPGSQYAGASLDGFWFDFEIVNIFGEPSRGATRRAERFGVMEHRTVPSREHPCEKPESLLGEIIAAYVNGCGLIDPFAGVGTTLVAAKSLGRRAIGVEVEARYCEIAVRRLRQGVLPL